MDRRALFIAALSAAFLHAACSNHSDDHEERVDNLPVSRILELARDGDPYAIHQACFRFRYGEKGVAKDEAQAFRWCSKGHELGIPSSSVLLAEILVGGSEKRRDRDRARLLYREAAEQGHPFAMYALGVMLTEDPRSDTDRDDGRYWLQRSADLEQEPAIEYLKQLGR